MNPLNLLLLAIAVAVAAELIRRRLAPVLTAWEFVQEGATPREAWAAIELGVRPFFARDREEFLSLFSETQRLRDLFATTAPGTETP